MTMPLPWHHERWARQPAPAPALDALRPWFDVERVGRVLAPMCPPHQPLQRVAIATVCYLPPQRLRVAYALHTAGGTCLHASIEASLDPAHPVHASATAARVGLDAGSAALAWLFPDDPADLPLATVTDAGFTERALGQAVRRGSDALLAYVPGERLAQRWQLASAPSAERGAVVLEQQPGAAATHARMQVLWHARRRFAMPQPLACDSAHDARWEGLVTGESFGAAAGRVGWQAATAAAVAALADLHAQGAAIARIPGGAPRSTRAALLERLGGKLLRQVQAALPQHADAVAARVDALQRWVPPPTPDSALLHGAFTPGHVRVDPEGQVVLLGLEGLAFGEAAADLARFATDLVLQSLLGRIEADVAWSLAVALPGAYREALRRADPDGAHAQGLLALPPPVFRENFAWHVAALLLSCQLAACIRHAAPAMDVLCHELVRLSGGVVADRGVATLAA